jgi:RNA polymerase sigma-70 factor (ECF subfamily)
MTDFQALYERYAPQVRRFALFLAGDSTLADDLTAETFVRAWTAPGTIRQETVKAYLFTIARNLYHDSLHHSRRLVLLDEHVQDKQPDPHKHAEDRSDLDFVLGEMQRLAEVDRAALLMSAQEGMSYDEISQALNLSLSAVKVKIHRARLMLMQSMMERSQQRSTRRNP